MLAGYVLSDKMVLTNAAAEMIGTPAYRFRSKSRSPVIRQSTCGCVAASARNIRSFSSRTGMVIGLGSMISASPRNSSRNAATSTPARSNKVHKRGRANTASSSASVAVLMTGTKKPWTNVSTIFPGGPAGEIRPETMMLVSTMTRTLPSYFCHFAGYGCRCEVPLLFCSPSQALNHAGRASPSHPSPFGLDKQHIALSLDRHKSAQPFQEGRGNQ